MSQSDLHKCDDKSIHLGTVPVFGQTDLPEDARPSCATSQFSGQRQSIAGHNKFSAKCGSGKSVGS